MRTTKLGSLTVRMVGGTDGRGGGDGPVVVLMHGFGAGGDDLVPLAPMLSVPEAVRFVFPEAPHELPRSMGGHGRMWWAIDVAQLARGASRDRRNEDPLGLVEARGLLVGMLDALRATTTIPKGGLVVGGFSQGSMLACDLAFRTEVPLDGLVILSGTMLAEPQWRAGMARRVGLPTFQSHGTQDPLLAYPIAEELSAAMKTAGLETRWLPFRGGHEIPMPVLRELASFLADRFADRP